MRDPLRDRQPCRIRGRVTPTVTFCVTSNTLRVTQGHEWLNHAPRQGSRLPFGEGGMNSLDLDETASTLEEDAA